VGAEVNELITVHVGNETSITLDVGSTILDLLTHLDKKLVQNVIAAEVNGEEKDLTYALEDADQLELIDSDSAQGRHILRHSTAHVMAQAVTSLWPGAYFAIGPAIEDGFYYDFFLPDGKHFTEADIERIEAEMRKIIAARQPFLREEYEPQEALCIFSDQPFKTEIIENIASTGSSSGEIAAEIATEAAPNASKVSAYRNSEWFVDLCRGPHVPHTGRLGHFKLLKVAGAYWRGDEKKQQLQRIYGTAFESEKMLNEHLNRLLEAERRDHRKLGLELDLFSFPDEIGSGLAVFHPKGGLVRKIMEDYSRMRHEQEGYQFVYSPHITKGDLFEISGHLNWFGENIFPPMEIDGENKYYLKPMNCPFHILIFRSKQRSYRELPLRLFEFGTVYRYEKSGVIHGLTRVRGMTQDDSHIFCTREQMTGELKSILTFVLDLLREFGLNDFYLELSTRPEGKAVGSDQEWEEATTALHDTANAMNIPLVLDEGGGAFYGPKISVQAKDAIGRTWQMSTVQLDFQLPQRFDISYIGSDNTKHRPVMIHRALFGTVERFFGVLLEHYAGALPTWLSPVQVKILPIRDTHEEYCLQLKELLAAEGIRIEYMQAKEPLGARIRQAKLEKIPYILAVGDEDVASGTVGINLRGVKDPIRAVQKEDFIAKIKEDIQKHWSNPTEGFAIDNPSAVRVEKELS
jgi:threonyl-tRNA synthetase